LTEIGCPFFDRCPLAIKDTCDQEAPPIRDLGEGHLISCHRPESEFLH
jgi:ABC-type dipeptide/oligopeptide/nickel transport system ATPase component